MSFISNTNAAINRAVATFEHLPIKQQHILCALAVVSKRVGITKFTQILRDLNSFDCFYNQALHKEFTPELRTQLIELGLLDANKKGLKVAACLAEPLAQLSMAKGYYEEVVDASDITLSVYGAYHWERPEYDDRVRIFRDTFYRQRFDVCEEQLEAHKNPQIINHEFNVALVQLCFYPFNRPLFNLLPPVLIYQAYATLFFMLRKQLVDNSEVVAELVISCQHHPESDPLRHLLAEQYVLANQPRLAMERLTDNESSTYALQLKACGLFLAQDMAGCISLFEQSIKAKNKLGRRKKQYIGEITGLFFAMAQLIEGSDNAPLQLSELLTSIDNQFSDQQGESAYRNSYLTLSKLAMLLMGKTKQFNLREPHAEVSDYFYHLTVLIGAVCIVWAKESPSSTYKQLLMQSVETFAEINHVLFAQWGQSIVDLWGGSDPRFAKGELNICQAISRKESWDLALEQLIALDQKAQPTTKAVAPKQSRIIWLYLNQGYGNYFEAKEQKLGKTGWSKGRVVALKRLLLEPQSFDYLTDEDLVMCKAISRHHGSGYYAKDYYQLGGIKALKAAAGLDNLYAEQDLEQPITIEKIEPELVIKQDQDGYLLSMANLPRDVDRAETSYSFVQHSQQVYWLILFDQKHLKIASIVGEGGLQVPHAAKEKVLQSIGAIAPMLNIQSNIDGVNTGVDTVSCDKRLFINIEPAGQGLAFDCHVEPLGANGPMLSPGVGHITFATEIEGKRVSTTRDLLHEQRQLKLLNQHCPSFHAMIDNRLICDELELALIALEQLESVCVSQSDQSLELVVQWPKGKKVSLSKKLSTDHLKLSVTKQKEWFGLEGTLEVSEDQVIELKTLMGLIAQSNSRFITLDDNQMLSLTDDLRQRLQTMEQATSEGKFHVLASPLIDSATQGMRLKTLDAWEKQKAVLAQANQFVPQIPSTLQAQLRDYQVDGFDWASRLAFWGGGACLADDMGLGKTLQALAVLLSRADKGPSLVLAPTSVGYNWQKEAARFSPTLKVLMFGESSDIDKRQQQLDNLGSFDLVVCSYGILQREGERLAKVKWQSIVADEAQALKNPLAKRTQAAMGLSAHFKMITTGTPIENNLTELWTLFRFINPGLLGSQKQFHKRFAAVIENSKDHDQGAIIRAKNGLRQLISPFILRRMKNQVLSELPSRTEINLPVSLSQDEVVLYEALRQQAVANLSQGDVSQGQYHIKMLSEIMRLRRACCHPSLVMPESSIAGSKLAVFDELMEELKQNNHKALVFSQFVDHLKILKAHLDHKGIAYQYLDGSTPAKARSKAVDAFQSGQGDVFLISLKAGGSGLNLTAADYVIHMDPWWNPAVEDQASDRAHRMGQTRPVTIYRLIAKDTIEDKIVALHQHKRDLANSLLEGSDSVNNFSAEDMMALLQTPL